MTQITIHREEFSQFDGSTYTIDLNRPFGGYQQGDLICSVAPFYPFVPLTLEIAIRTNGDIIFRSWKFNDLANKYLHTAEVAEADKDHPFSHPFIATQAQIDTVNGLFSERLDFEGLRLPPGATLQKICPIDINKEEKITGKKIYLA